LLTTNDKAKTEYAYSPNKGRHLPMITVEYVNE